MITAATLFSGIGAPETAMPHWHWAWHAEIERAPAAVLAARHPQSVNLGDVTADDFCERAAAVGKPTVLVFGSPCQSFSVAGKRLGLDDPRGNLALVALGIVARLEPRWFVFENVPGLLSSADGADFGLFLRTVDELGYSLAWTVLDAQYFGVAQRRERVFAVGYLGDWRYPAAVLFEPESLCGHSSPRREAGQRPAPTIAARTKGGGGLGTDFDCDGGLIAAEQSVYRLYTANDDVRQAAARVDVSATLNGTCDRIGNTGTQVVVPPDAIAFDTTQITSKANRCQPQQGDPCHPLAAGAHPPAIAFDASQDPCSSAELSRPLRNQHNGLSNGLMTGMAVRRLTPKECERLQGFPDLYTAIVHRGKPMADGPRYKMLGNSMAVPAIRWPLARIEALEQQRAAA